jgi:protein involved in polysaccharide export with SLBB domain
MFGRFNTFGRSPLLIGLRVATLLAVVLPVPGLAQATSGSQQVHVSRDSLAQLQSRLEETANSKAYSQALRDRARRESELLKARLQQGDFQTGDRIYLAVDRQPELTDTFTVAPGPKLVLPSVQEVSLAGLLRAELEPQLREHLKRFLVNPQVNATPLMRIWIDGGVSSPGVYLLPAHTLVTDALMRAGGTTREAKVTSVRIERGNKRIWEGEALQRAITEGKTLDQLSLQAGDRIIVEERGGGGLQNIQTILMTVIPLIALIGTRVF